MNTLNRDYTSKFFATPQDYAALRRQRGKVSNCTAEQQLLYLCLMGKDWRKAFTPVTNTVKLENGMRPYGAAQRARERVHWLGTTSYMSASALGQLLTPFEGRVTLEMLREVAKLLPEMGNEKLPDEAYCVKGAEVVKPAEAV